MRVGSWLWHRAAQHPLSATRQPLVAQQEAPLKQLLAASFYSLPSALGLSNFFPAIDPSPCLLSTCAGTGGP